MQIPSDEGCLSDIPAPPPPPSSPLQDVRTCTCTCSPCFWLIGISLLDNTVESAGGASKSPYPGLCSIDREIGFFLSFFLFKIGQRVLDGAWCSQIGTCRYVDGGLHKIAVRINEVEMDVIIKSGDSFVGVASGEDFPATLCLNVLGYLDNVGNDNQRQ